MKKKATRKKVTKNKSSTKKSSDSKTASFELKLVVIAILIPVLLETIPYIFKTITYPFLTFALPIRMGYFLGAGWLIVLCSGLLNLTNFNISKIGEGFFFPPLYDSGAIITSVIVAWVGLAYIFFYLAKLISDLGISILYAILGLAWLIILIIYLFKSSGGK